MSTLQQQHAAIFERYIRQECNGLWKAERIAGDQNRWKNHEAPNVPGEEFPRARSKPDFSGILYGSGRGWAFEAKAVRATTSLPLSRLEDHQADYLRDVHEGGGLAFIYVLDGDRNKWVYPWAQVEAAGQVRGSLPLSDARAPRPFEVDRLQKQGSETWLDTLIRLEVCSE